MNNTLLVLAGSAPQVVTASIYALAEKGVVVDEVVAVCFEHQVPQLLASLNGPRQGGLSPLEHLASELACSSISLDVSNLLVPKNCHGISLSHISTIGDVETLAECIFSLLRRITLDSERAIYASISNGAREMAFYLSYAMAIYAREQDSMSHVFFKEGYEHSEFFFPTQQSEWFQSAKGPLDKSKGTVTLLEMPFVRLRDSLPRSLIQSSLNLEQARAIHQLANQDVSLELDDYSTGLICSGVYIEMTESNYAFYRMLVVDLQDAKEGYDSPNNEEPCTVTALHYINQRMAIHGMPLFDALDVALDYAEENLLSMRQNEIDGLRYGMKKSFFNQRKFEINQSIRAALPSSIAEHYDIDTLYKTRRKGASKPVNFFGLNIESSRVRMAGEDV